MECGIILSPLPPSGLSPFLPPRISKGTVELPNLLERESCYVGDNRGAREPASTVSAGCWWETRWACDRRCGNVPQTA